MLLYKNVPCFYGITVADKGWVLAMETMNKKIKPSTTRRQVVGKGTISIALLSLCALFLAPGCKNKQDDGSIPTTDVVLIGGGIMSATLGSLLSELAPEIRVDVYERLDDVALESTFALNNAGTGHAAYCELNYTPEVNGKIDLTKAINVNASFELSKQMWAYLVQHKKLPEPHQFINDVPHMSFVFGEKDRDFLKKRYEAMKEHPFFTGMQYSEDHNKLKKWIPLIMDGREPDQIVAATRMVGGVDVDFGAVTKGLFAHMASSKNHNIHLLHEVTDLTKNSDSTWKVSFKDLKNDKESAINARFVFIGAGGGALRLLEKSGIEESRGYGGFPVGGAWLMTENQDLIERHWGKVYGQAKVGAPPMSVPHLDTRFINGKRSLLFGPFATFSTKFLKNGSWVDLFASVNTSNIIPMLQVSFHNFNLVQYLIGQVMMSEKERVDSLKDYVPKARLEDWKFAWAGQRVQIIKKIPEKGGILQFGTELVSSKDGSIVALLGASPGASIAVKVMIDMLKIGFKDHFDSDKWQRKLHEMIPSYGHDLAKDVGLLRRIQSHNAKVLNIRPVGTQE